jgi:hypothetical protein
MPRRGGDRGTDIVRRGRGEEADEVVAVARAAVLEGFAVEAGRHSPAMKLP